MSRSPPEDTAPLGRPAIVGIVPDRASYRPGDEAHVAVVLVGERTSVFRGRLTLDLTHLDRTVERLVQVVAVEAGERQEVIFRLTPPPEARRGYGLDATLTDAGGRVLAIGSGALDILVHWSQAPRYGFLSEFGPEQATTSIGERISSLGRYHLNVVQCYDWMWRHYRLLPPTEEFTDALGRRLSLATVRATVAAVQAQGGAALAYGAVYGAEPEFADEHPELTLFDEQGQPISLAGLFTIMNIAPDSPWVPLIVAEFAAAVREVGFDGIHLDQYGFPKTARTSGGEVVDLADHFPPLIEAARAAVVAERPDAGVIFNAVANWPIETVAPTTQDAVYIEVWPPDDDYDDLRRLIRDAKPLGGGKPVILAAYLSPFLDAHEAALPGAEAAALLATATIAASGGFHLLLGERDGILCDPYYPKYATLRPAFAATMRAYSDFLVRYQEFLTAPGLEEWDHAAEATLGGGAVRLAAGAEPGAVWTIGTRTAGYRVLHLINLTDQQDAAWNAPRTPPQPLDDLELVLHGLLEVRRAWLVTPDADLGRPRPLTVRRRGDRLVVRVPRLHVWAIVVCALHDAQI